MLDNVQLEHLVLAPFREVVARARTAVGNAETASGDEGDGAGNTNNMTRAAKGLVTKGERALAKLEPVCERLWKEYGMGFVDAVKESGRSLYFCVMLKRLSILLVMRGC